MTYRQLIFLAVAAIPAVALPEITSIPAPVLQHTQRAMYPDRALAFFNNTGAFSLHSASANQLANGSLVTVAQIERDLAANGTVTAGKTMTYHYDSDGTNDRKNDYANHANYVGSILYSSESDFYFATYTKGYSPGIENVHAFTTDAYRMLLDGTNTLGTLGIQVVNISNTMGSGGAIAQIRKHDQMLDEENILAFHAHPSSAVGSFSHTAWNGLVVGTTAIRSTHGPLTKYENLSPGGTQFKRQSPVIVSPSAQFGVDGGASSYSTPVVASGAARLLDYALDSGKTNAARNLVIKATLLSGATKEFPGRPAYGWSQTQERPLDPQMGAGTFNINNAYAILQQPEGIPGTGGQMHYGWDLGEVQAAASNEYRFGLSHGGRFIATLCWHRKIATDRSSFSLADLTLVLEQWNPVSEEWDEVFESRNAGENIEHVAPHIDSGEYRLCIESAEADPTEYGIAWRFDPCPSTALINDYGYVQVSSTSPFTNNFTVAEAGRCIAGAYNNQFAPSPGIKLKLKRENAGSWQIVHTANGTQALWETFNLEVSPGNYQLEITTTSSSGHHVLCACRVDRDDADPRDASALLSNLLLVGKYAPLDMEFDGDQLELSVHVPMFMHEFRGNYSLAASTNLMTGWSGAAASPTQSFQPENGAWRRQWTFDETTLPTEAFYKIEVTP